VLARKPSSVVDTLAQNGRHRENSLWRLIEGKVVGILRLRLVLALGRKDQSSLRMTVLVSEFPARRLRESGLLAQQLPEVRRRGNI